MSFQILFLISKAVIFTTIIPCVFSATSNKNSSDLSNSSYNFTLLVVQNGFNSEEHTVTTDDGYILTMFRIYKGNEYEETDKSTPVLIHHGSFQDSGCWIDSGPDAGLAYNLSGAGYDTWLGNSRGNMYSMKHVSLNADTDNEYWEYTTDDIGNYDISAMIKYILQKTNKEKINYIGFSQGGTTGLIAFSRPELCSKVGVFIALAPGSTLKNTAPLLKIGFEGVAELEGTLNKAGIYKTFADDSLYTRLNMVLSNIFLTRSYSCRPLISALDSNHPGSIEDSTFANICPHFPAPTSIRNIANYGQISKAGKFQKYDYGKEENLSRYGTAEPPEYNITEVCVPVMIAQGINDPIAAANDTEILASQLPQLEELYIVDDPLWNHFDMSYSKYSKEKLFPKINQYLLKYSNVSNFS